MESIEKRTKHVAEFAEIWCEGMKGTDAGSFHISPFPPPRLLRILAITCHARTRAPPVIDLLGESVVPTARRNSVRKFMRKINYDGKEGLLNRL